jgi:hypothetical protein
VTPHIIHPTGGKCWGVDEPGSLSGRCCTQLLPAQLQSPPPQPPTCTVWPLTTTSLVRGLRPLSHSSSGSWRGSTPGSRHAVSSSHIVLRHGRTQLAGGGAGDGKGGHVRGGWMSMHVTEGGECSTVASLPAALAAAAEQHAATLALFYGSIAAKQSRRSMHPTPLATLTSSFWTANAWPAAGVPGYAQSALVLLGLGAWSTMALLLWRRHLPPLPRRFYPSPDDEDGPTDLASHIGCHPDEEHHSRQHQQQEGPHAAAPVGARHAVAAAKEALHRGRAGWAGRRGHCSVRARRALLGEAGDSKPRGGGQGRAASRDTPPPRAPHCPATADRCVASGAAPFDQSCCPWLLLAAGVMRQGWVPLPASTNARRAQLHRHTAQLPRPSRRACRRAAAVVVVRWAGGPRRCCARCERTGAASPVAAHARCLALGSHPPLARTLHTATRCFFSALVRKSARGQPWVVAGPAWLCPLAPGSSAEGPLQTIGLRYLIVETRQMSSCGLCSYTRAVEVSRRSDHVVPLWM